MDEGPTAQRAQVVGLGLIGTSVAIALKKADWHVTGTDANDVRARRALELGAIDAIGSDRGASLAVVATPVAAIAEVATSLFKHTECVDLVVTDVGGVKGAIVEQVDHPRFVGGHPMAGSEQEGPDGAAPDLFEGATWVLTPTSTTDSNAFATVRAVVASFGAEIVALAPRKHDSLVAVISHLPHLVAANLMVLAADAAESDGALLQLAAGGFRDMTRIAAGDPAIWPSIFSDNADAVVGVLDDLIERLNVARDIAVRKDREQLVALLDRARVARRNLPARVSRPESIIELRIPVPDRPGVLAEVTTVLGTLGVNVFDLEIAHSAEGPRGVLVVSVGADDQERAGIALRERGYRVAIGAPGAR